MTDRERAQKLFDSAFYYGNLSQQHWLDVLESQFAQVREDERQRAPEAPSVLQEYVVAQNPEAARIYMQVQSFSYKTSLEQARAVRRHLAGVDPDFAGAKIYQKVIGVREVE